MPAIDYAALAKQAGAFKSAPPPAAVAEPVQPTGIDYGALAKEAGAIEPSKPDESWLHTALGVAGDVGVGALKGAGDTFNNLGRLTLHAPIVGRFLKAANTAMYGMTPEQQDVAFSELEKSLTASNTSQRVGKVGEQIAETVIPASKIAGAGEVAARVVAPHLAPAVGEVAARVLPRALVEGAGMAGVSAAQGGNPIVGGALGAAAPAVGEAINSMAPALRTAAEKKVVQALGATKERYKAVAERLAPGILQRGLWGSRETLQAHAAETLSDVGQQIDAALAKHGAEQVGIAPITDALEKAKDAFRATNPTTGEIVQIEPRAIQQLAGLQTVVTALGPDATVENLTAVRRAWDKVVSQAGGFEHRAGVAIGVPLKDQSEAWAKREGAGAIRKLLADEFPDMAAINKEYSFWKGLSDVLTQTLKRTQPQGPGLGRTLAEGAGSIVGGAAGSAAGPAGAVGGAVFAGKVAAMAKTAFESPRWKLVDARMKSALADAIQSGSASRMAMTLSRISAVQGSKVETP